MKPPFALWFAFLVFLFTHPTLSAQSIHSGTVSGVIKDQTGSVVPGAKVNLRNPVTGYEQNMVADSTGAYRFNNIPLNNYRLTAEAPGFAPTIRTIDVRSSLPIVADISLDLLAASTALT
jgi:Carboxypeptidase regulatory-like domain